ncbi:MAG: serine/threonine protein phosphatase [Oscillospiraceae bacterium]|nr:serine/threonine protein phosphatase [Oscillospiraceae bacterium]
MNYVISDPHGCYTLFQRMLEEIRFSAADTLYLLGDVADRGRDGIPLLLDVMQRENVVMLRGNHEDMFLQAIKNAENKPSLLEQFAAIRSFVNWTDRNGGKVTWDAFQGLQRESQRAIRDYLSGLKLYEDLTVNGRRFLLVHAGVGAYEKNKQPQDCDPMDMIWTRMDYTKAYYDDRYLVTGHTPTVLIDPQYKGKIYRANRHIAMDCGAVFFGTLGCLCLDTMEEFYCSEPK